MEKYSQKNPPDAFNSPNLEPVPYDRLPSFLQKLVDEHKVCTKELNEFEDILAKILNEGRSAETNSGLAKFFKLLDNKKLHHNTKEEKLLFPLLQQHLLKIGEYSKGPFPKTELDLMEDDHIKIIQIAAVSFNLFNLAVRLSDKQSRIIVLDAAIEQGKALAKAMRLHIFREDNIVFSMACKHLSEKEFQDLDKQVSKFDYYT